MKAETGNCDKDGYLLDHETGQRAVMYACDPSKNKKCLKFGCYRGGGECRLTTNPSAAKDGTMPAFVKATGKKRMPFKLVLVDKAP